MKTVEFILEVEPEDVEVRGNAMSSGDDDIDRECEDKIIAEIEGGNVWAWASVRVAACVDGIEYADYLGCCNYASEEDFRQDAYYLDMKGEALGALRDDIEAKSRALGRAEKDLAAEREAYDKRQSEMECWRCPHCKEIVWTGSGYNDIPFCGECDTQRDRFDPVDVVFLRDRDDGDGGDDGDICAVFPGEASSATNPRLMTCYAPMGGHSGAAPEYCDDCTEVTDPKEYADLATQLDRIGYNIRVVRKDNMGDDKYTDSRLRQLQR